MFDDDSNSGFELLSSQEKRPYDVVPQETFFKFKIKSESGDISRKISYKLKQGSTLPYTTNIGGIILRLDYETLAFENILLCARAGSRACSICCLISNCMPSLYV